MILINILTQLSINHKHLKDNFFVIYIDYFFNTFMLITQNIYSGFIMYRYRVAPQAFFCTNHTVYTLLVSS